MQKGKLGIVLSFYAILSFILAALGQTLLCGILLLFVLFVEKDEWASKQVMQGFFLALFDSIVTGVVSLLNITKFTDAYLGGYSLAMSYINEIAWIIVVVCAIVGIVNTAKGSDAKIPCLSTLAEKSFGHMPVPSNNMGGYNQPNPQQNYQQSPYETTSQNQNNNAPRV